MNKQSLDIISTTLINRLLILNNVNEVDKLEVMLLINNMMSSVEEYEECRQSMQKSYERRKCIH